ncbi:MAG TPA: aldose 1-epimerase [Chitinophagaceae bacterium]|nr:aldose 1-epimerase [Chitinophagaceae bacterium]
MAFAVSSQQTRGLEEFILEDLNTFTRIIILPEHGGLLNGFEVRHLHGTVNILDNYIDRHALEEGIEKSFKGAKLSPYPCRITEGTYEIDGRKLSFNNEGGKLPAIHGLLYNKVFSEVGHFCDDYQASLHLKYNYNREDPGYPFEYRCELLYTLFPGNILLLQTTIINLDSNSIPLADGWHPYFTLGGNVNDWYLRFQSDFMVELGDNLVPTGRLLSYNTFETAQAIGNTEFDNCFLLTAKVSSAACILFNPVNKLSVSFFPGESYPYLLIYTPPGRQSIAIENVSAPPDCFNNKMGLLMLAPGHSKTFSIYYKIGSE